MIRERFQKLKDKQDPNDALDTVAYGLCKTFGWDYFTLMEQPIPYVRKMVEQINKENKEAQKQIGR